jgi:tetratricopeptide (TPR) repeat protein
MIRPLLLLATVILFSTIGQAQAPEPPIADTRLTVHTLVREDIFAGFLQNDTIRLARAERNLELLLATRPGDRASLLAWQGSAALTRATLAQEANRPAEFEQHYRRARGLFDEAMRLEPDSVAVFAIVGGSQVSMADRLPPAVRAESWELGFTAYQRLWTLQQAIIEKLPLHHKGEVLSGLAQTAQRTGRTDEAGVHLDRILTLLPGSPYAARAQQWKDNASARADVRITCQTCHGPGTLAAQIAEVSKQ